MIKFTMKNNKKPLWLRAANIEGFWADNDGGTFMMVAGKHYVVAQSVAQVLEALGEVGK